MENPDAYRAGKELIEFRWQQTHTNSSRCFTMHFYLENGLPVLTGRFMSPDGGETRENGRGASSTPIPWQLTWVQWFELQNTLAEAALPAYEKPSHDAAEEAGSEICIVWRTEDGERSEKCSGEDAAALERHLPDADSRAVLAGRGQKAFTPQEAPEHYALLVRWAGAVLRGFGED